MKKRRINWWNLGIVLMIVSIITLLILTPYFVRYANDYRASLGVSGTGGEGLTWIYPFIYLVFYFDHKVRL